MAPYLAAMVVTGNACQPTQALSCIFVLTAAGLCTGVVRRCGVPAYAPALAAPGNGRTRVSLWSMQFRNVFQYLPEE